MTDTFDIERAERDDWEILHKGDAARLLLDGCTDAAGMHVIEQDGYFLRAFPGRIRNIPAAEPSPVEHTVAVGVWRMRNGELYRAEAECVDDPGFFDTWWPDQRIIASLLHYADGDLTAWTKPDGVRVELMPRIGDIHKHTREQEAKLSAAIDALDGEATDG